MTLIVVVTIRNGIKICVDIITKSDRRFKIKETNIYIAQVLLKVKRSCKRNISPT